MITMTMRTMMPDNLHDYRVTEGLMSWDRQAASDRSLRSRITIEAMDRAPQRAFLRAMGLDEEAIAKPLRYASLCSTSPQATVASCRHCSPRMIASGELAFPSSPRL